MKLRQLLVVVRTELPWTSKDCLSPLHYVRWTVWKERVDRTLRVCTNVKHKPVVKKDSANYYTCYHPGWGEDERGWWELRRGGHLGVGMGY